MSSPDDGSGAPYHAHITRASRYLAATENASSTCADTFLRPPIAQGTLAIAPVACGSNCAGHGAMELALLFDGASRG